jgi:integrase
MPTPAIEEFMVAGDLYRHEAWGAVGLAWEDIDLKAGTLTVKRNHTQTDEFTLPKTEAGTDRVIFSSSQQSKPLKVRPN